MRGEKVFAGGVVFILSAFYYISHRLPGPGFIDSGELALCSYLFGVPHPTGYPLYLILTRPVTLLAERPITAVTVLGGIISALAGAALFGLITAVRERLFPGLDRHNIGGAILTLVIMLSPVAAFQGMTNEVYGLGLLLNVTAILFGVRCLWSECRGRQWRFLAMAWYMTGMSLANHMSSVYLIAAMVAITVMILRRGPDVRIVVVSAGALVLPLTVYAVLPIRAAAAPGLPVGWGEVTSWKALYRHVSGWQFRVWMFEGDPAQVWANVKNLGRVVYGQFPAVILPLAAVGWYSMARRSRRLLGVLALMGLVNIVLGVNYGIPDIESYFLPTVVIVFLSAVTGLAYMAGRVRWRGVFAVAALGLLVWQAALMHSTNNKVDYTLPEDYARNIMRSADTGAIVMSEIWDHFAQAYYLQQAEGVRRDLKLIDKELLRRSWYFTVLKNTYPDAYECIDDLVPGFLIELAHFEDGRRFDARRLEYYYQKIINRLLTECGTAYIDYRLEYTPERDQYIRKQGLLYRVDTIAVNHPLAQPHLVWQGRPLETYSDWRARYQVAIIAQLAEEP